jgi:beta-glucosidase
VQLYLSDRNAPVTVPIHSLEAFKRIHVAAGQTEAVTLVIAPNAFSVIDNDNKRIILPGKFDISVGGSQPGTIGEPHGKILTTTIELTAKR